jgi:magnesium chelatase subunit H
MGLVGQGLALQVGERVLLMPLQERRLAILLYGFPPGVGATGTAALLNVPKSLEALLGQLAAAGYDLGEGFVAKSGAVDGETLVNALRAQEDQRGISAGAAGIERGCGLPLSAPCLVLHAGTALASFKFFV